MTNTKQKINAVFLSALMVVSVFAAAIAFSGAAAAANRSTGGFDYSTGPSDTNNPNGLADSTGQVGPGATVFQGEEDLQPNGNFGGTDVGALQKVSGDNSGILLENPIPQDQPTGTYTDNGNSNGDGVTLQTPRITDVEVQNSGGGDVTGGILQQSGSNTADVLVNYNYEEAEDVEITVEDEDGLEVTSEILSGTTEDTLNPNFDTGTAGSDFDVGFEIDPSNVDEGQYTITVEGVEDLDFGEATETVTVNISADQTASLDIEDDEVTQGEDVTFNVDNSPEGNFHAVIIESDEFRDGTTVSEAQNIFRNVGDVSDAGLVNSGNNVSSLGTSGSALAADNSDYAYAIVEVDGGTGVGSIETQFVDDSSIDVELFSAGDAVDTNGNYNNGDDLLSSSFSSDDEQDFEVVEGEVSLDSPSGTYVTGSEVTVNGTAAEGINEVAIYARDNGRYQIVTVDGSDDVITVDGDNTFEEEDVTLSGEGNTGGNDILGLPGSYRIGVIDTNDIKDASGNVPSSISTSDFNSNVSSATSLRVTDTQLNGTFTTYNGQIATDDEQVDVSGQAPGKDNVAVVFVGPRGNTVAQEVSVNDDDTFEEEDISISGLGEGTVTAHIISSGRDDTFGEDGGTFQRISQFDTSNSVLDSSSTANQIRDRILASTVDDTASDDLIVNEQFRLSDGLTTIDSVSSPVEANGTIQVEGTTNRRPEDNTVTVEILNEDDESLTVDSTDEWGSNGEWSVAVDLSDTDVEPGNYTIESDDGDNTDRASVQIVEAGSLEEEQPDTETPEPDTETPEPDTETPEPDTETPEPDTETPEPSTDMETEEATTEASGPGFTAAIALIALVAAALLAVRRDN
jgi:major cell surface glycoprotein (TIGR04216 family)